MKTYLKIVAVFFAFAICLGVFGQETNSVTNTNGPVTSSPTAAVELFNIPAPLLLGAVIAALGKVIKESPISSWMIPYFSFIFGAVGYGFLAGWTPYNVILGLAIGGGVVGAHQAIVQPMINRKANDGATTFLEKKDVENKPGA